MIIFIEQLAPSFAIRKINDIRIERGYPLTVTNDEYPGIEYWNIHVNARSFVYRQVRESRICSSADKNY